MSGALTPFKPDDKASEVIFKSSKGVPYQASIYFDPWSCVVEDVPAGMSTEVNGQTFNGPVTVFRQWQLMGLAVCMYGVDSGTNVAFSNAQNLSGKTVAVTRFKKGEEVSTKTSSQKPGQLSEGSTETEKKTTSEDTKPDTRTESETDTKSESDSESTETNSTTTKKPEGESDTKLSRKELGAKFIGAFGEQHGPALFAKGLSFAEATAEFTKLQTAEITALRAENAKFKKGDSVGTDPVSFGGAAKSEIPTKFQHLGNIGRFAAGIKLPGAK